MSELTWSPTIDFVRETIANEGQLRLLIAPFIKLDALRALVEECQDTSQLQVVVRWHGSDLASGVSDVDIYPYLKEKGISLFRHTSIHLKLFIYSQSLAFHTSGNITRKGLGLASNRNLEIGCAVVLDVEDWRNLYDLLAGSTEVDEQMYEQALAYTRQNATPAITAPKMKLQPAEKKAFSRDSLPASESPKSLYQFYSEGLGVEQKVAESAEYVHDLILYSIPQGLDRDDFFTVLKTRFRESEFIRALVDFIRKEESARFGAVNAWLTQKCSDSPRPFRRDLKTTTRHLYSWLTYFFEEISWDTPNYSMVIYWMKGNGQSEA